MDVKKPTLGRVASLRNVVRGKASHYFRSPPSVSSMLDDSTPDKIVITPEVEESKVEEYTIEPLPFDVSTVRKNQRMNTRRRSFFRSFSERIMIRDTPNDKTSNVVEGEEEKTDETPVVSSLTDGRNHEVNSVRVNLFKSHSMRPVLNDQMKKETNDNLESLDENDTEGTEGSWVNNDMVSPVELPPKDVNTVSKSHNINTSCRGSFLRSLSERIMIKDIIVEESSIANERDDKKEIKLPGFVSAMDGREYNGKTAQRSITKSHSTRTMFEDRMKKRFDIRLERLDEKGVGSGELDSNETSKINAGAYGNNLRVNFSGLKKSFSQRLLAVDTLADRVSKDLKKRDEKAKKTTDDWGNSSMNIKKSWSDEESEVCMNTVLTKLENNDPDTINVSIKDLSKAKARRYGFAMRNNTWLSSLDICHIDDTEELTGGGLRPLLACIQKNERLQTLSLYQLQNPTVVAHFATAVSRSFIVELRLSETTISSKCLLNLVSSTQSIKTLSMGSLQITEDNDASLESLADVFAQNQTIVKLECNRLQDDFLVLLLEKLGINKSITCFTLSGCTIGDIVAHSLQLYLKESNTVQQINFNDFGFSTATFAPICVGITESRSLRELGLFFCSFSPSSVGLFQNIFLNPISCIEILRVSSCRFKFGLSELISNILRCKPEKSPLKHVCLHSPAEHSTDSNNIDINRILSTFEEESVSLENLEISGLNSWSYKNLEQLAFRIGRLKGLRSIRLNRSANSDLNADQKELLLKAFRKNKCLEKADVVNHNLDDDDRYCLEYCCARNRLLLPFDSSSMPRSYFPHILHGTFGYKLCQHDMVFGTLLSWGRRDESQFQELVSIASDFAHTRISI